MFQAGSNFQNCNAGCPLQLRSATGLKNHLLVSRDQAFYATSLASIFEDAPNRRGPTGARGPRDLGPLLGPSGRGPGPGSMCTGLLRMPDGPDADARQPGSLDLSSPLTLQYIFAGSSQQKLGKLGCLNSKADGSDPYASAANSKHDECDDIPDFGISELFEVKTMLGEGGSGQTWLSRDLKTQEEVAIKFIPRPIPKIVLPMIKHEIKIQADLGDGHVNLWDTVASRNGLFLSEDEARYFVRQFFDAVEYLHQNRVAHRDLKLDNIVLDGSRPPRIKVCDFGFAKNWDADNCNMNTQIGTPVYMSPQLISARQTKQGYDATKADLWACGVLLFVMLLGMFPFEHTEHPDPNSSEAHVEVWLQQIKCSWRENPRVSDSAAKLSESCRDLLDKIFELDEGRRITIEGIRAHPWYTKKIPDKYEAALKAIQLDQLIIDKNVEGGKFVSEERDKSLELLLEQTGKHAEPGEKITRIDLTRVQRLPSSTPSSSTPSKPALQTQPMQSEERDKALELLLEQQAKHADTWGEDNENRSDKGATATQLNPLQLNPIQICSSNPTHAERRAGTRP
eukprot:gene19999-26712_t